MPGLSDISAEGWTTWAIATVAVFVLIAAVRFKREHSHIWKAQHWASAIFLSLIFGLLVAIGVDLVPGSAGLEQQDPDALADIIGEP